MKTFQIYTHQHASPEAVKLGFSWPALFFTILWMLVNKLWGLAAICFGAYAASSIIEKIADQSTANGGQLALYMLALTGYLAPALLAAFKGNKWREQNLVKRGYQFRGTVQAATTEGALALQPEAPNLTPAQTSSTNKTGLNTTPKLVQQHAIATTSTNTAPASVDEDAIYTAIAQELETNSTDKGIWTRLFAECDGDENTTKAKYIKERANRLITAEGARLEQVWREESARLEANHFERIRLRGLELRERIQTRNFTPELTNRIHDLAISNEGIAFMNQIRYAELDAIEAMLVAEPLLVAVTKSDGTTPLHIAVTELNPKMVEFLLEKGAAPDFANAAGITPIDLANKLGQNEVAKMLSAMSLQPKSTSVI